MEQGTKVTVQEMFIRNAVARAGKTCGTSGVANRLRSFFSGIGSVLEILPPSRTYLPEGELEEAIQKDWDAVASDLWAAVQATKQE